MPLEKMSLSMENPPEKSVFFMARIDTRLLKRVDALRRKKKWTKTALIENLCEDFLAREKTEKGFFVP